MRVGRRGSLLAHGAIGPPEGEGGRLVRLSRIVITASLLTAGLLGVYWVATAQEGRVPWPPPPVKFDDGGGSVLVLPSTPPSISPQSIKTPAPEESKGAAEKKPGPGRKWFSGSMLAGGQETQKTKQGVNAVQQVRYQDIPPPTPPKLTVPPETPPTMPPAIDSDPRPAPMAKPLALAARLAVDPAAGIAAWRRRSADHAGRRSAQGRPDQVGYHRARSAGPGAGAWPAEKARLRRLRRPCRRL